MVCDARSRRCFVEVGDIAERSKVIAERPKHVAAR